MGWEAGRLDGWEAGRLGGWEAGGLGGGENHVFVDFWVSRSKRLQKVMKMIPPGRCLGEFFFCNILVGRELQGSFVGWEAGRLGGWGVGWLGGWEAGGLGGGAKSRFCRFLGFEVQAPSESHENDTPGAMPWRIDFLQHFGR